VRGEAPPRVPHTRARAETSRNVAAARYHAAHLHHGHRFAPTSNQYELLCIRVVFGEKQGRSLEAVKISHNRT